MSTEKNSAPTGCDGCNKSHIWYGFHIVMWSGINVRKDITKFKCHKYFGGTFPFSIWCTVIVWHQKHSRLHFMFVQAGKRSQSYDGTKKVPTRSMSVKLSLIGEPFTKNTLDWRLIVGCYCLTYKTQDFICCSSGKKISIVEWWNEGSTKSTVCEIVFDWGSTYLEMKVPIIIGDKAVALFTNKVQPIHVWNIGTIRVPTKSTVCEIVLDWETLTKNILYFLREKRT